LSLLAPFLNKHKHLQVYLGDTRIFVKAYRRKRLGVRQIFAKETKSKSEQG
jgi:hypothetical protein